jgi:hypothetical protein
MPRYVIAGADRETGEDRTMDVRAGDAAAAEALAACRGILVHRVYPIERRAWPAVALAVAAWLATAAAVATVALLDRPEAPATGEVASGDSKSRPATPNVAPATPDVAGPGAGARAPRVSAGPERGWVAPGSMQEVVPGITFVGGNDFPETEAYGTLVRVSMVLRNETGRDQRLAWRVRAVSASGRTIHLDELTMTGRLVLRARDRGNTVFWAAYRLPEREEDRYAQTVIEFRRP